jgi:hypothetical protein
MSDLMQKLAISKAIMDKHNSIGRGGIPQTTNYQTPVVENYEAPSANYNIPNEYVSESNIPKQIDEVPTKDRILNSKLPEEIKRLMMENPIQSVNPLSASNTSVLSDELVEKASKLMGTNKPQQSQSVQRQPQGQNVPDTDLRKMMKEVVQEVLKENGLITESTSKSDEIMMIKVGKHLFEGKISKVKKLK